MSSIARSDPVTEIFEAIAAAKRRAAGGHDDWKVLVRSRTGQLLASFLLASEEQVLAFAELVRPLGYQMAPSEWEAGRCFDFSLERRAANETIDHPRRRKDD